MTGAPEIVSRVMFDVGMMDATGVGETQPDADDCNATAYAELATPSCPALHGVVTRQGTTLVARAGDMEWQMQAPASWLDQLLAHCDGTRPLPEILAGLPYRVPRREFAEMIRGLMASGMLIEGRHLALQALHYGEQMSPYGMPAPQWLTNRIARRDFDTGTDGSPLIEAQTALSPLFERRVSATTFGNGDISEAQLSALLWSLCGVVACEHPRLGPHVSQRTIASAGAMHLLRVHLVLKRAVGHHAAGVYDIAYPGPRQVTIKRLGDASADVLYRAFQQPWHLERAQGIVMLTADANVATLRYRNRAIQYLFTEAGAALHNGALSAADVALAYVPLGCYDERRLMALCQCASAGQIVLGTAAFGTLSDMDRARHAAGTTEPTPADATTTPILPAEFCWIGDTLSPKAETPESMVLATSSYQMPLTLARVVRHAAQRVTSSDVHAEVQAEVSDGGWSTRPTGPTRPTGQTATRTDVQAQVQAGVQSRAEIQPKARTEARTEAQTDIPHRTRIETTRDDDTSWGYDADPMTACRKAWAEAVEREGFHTPQDLREDCFDARDTMLHPDHFVRYHDVQFQQRDFPFARMTPHGVYRWKAARSWQSDAAHWVPADLVYARKALNALPTLSHHGAALTHATTSGCAASADIAHAIEHAVYEAVEHDAFMRHWLTQQAGIPLDPASLPLALRQRMVDVQDTGARVGIQLLPSRWAPVVLAWMQHEEYGFTTIAAAARSTLEAAVSAALGELEPRAYTLLQRAVHPDIPRKPLLRDVHTPADHFLLYTHPHYFQRADAVLKPARATMRFGDAAQQCAAAIGPTHGPLADRLCAHGIAPLIVDITPRHCAIPLGPTTLHAVKVLVPSFVPLAFGFRREPRGMVDDVRPGAVFPHPLS